MQDQDVTMKFIGERYSSYAKDIQKIWISLAYEQTSRETDIFFGLFCLLSHKNHKHFSNGENVFFFTHVITILSLFTYSVCDDKVKSGDKSPKRKTILTMVSQKKWQFFTCNKFFLRIFKILE